MKPYEVIKIHWAAGSTVPEASAATGIMPGTVRKCFGYFDQSAEKEVPLSVINEELASIAERSEP